MPTATDVIVHSLTNSKNLLLRYVEDLTPAEYLQRPADKSNCAAWVLGHLVLSERRALAMLGFTDLPALPEGFDKRFSRDEGCPQAEEFGDVSVLVPLFSHHRDILIEKVKSATPELLEKPLEKKHPFFSTIWELVNFMSLHVVTHAGQITIIRRCLGRPILV